MRVAIAITILLNSPVRLLNLVSLQFGTHLRLYGSRHGLITHLVPAAHETKNTRSYEQPVDPDLAKMIEIYRTKYHPLLAPNGSAFLFPAGEGLSGHLAECTMYSHVNLTFEKEAGAYANPNLFRHLAVRFILEDSPNAFEDARQMLGDKDPAVVSAHYASMEPVAAARRHHERLRRARNPAPVPKSGREKKT